MKNFLLLLCLICLILPNKSYCQIFRQATGQSMELETWANSSTQRNQISLLQYGRSGGGDSGGGGSGVFVNGKLRLKDFVNCKSLDSNIQKVDVTGNSVSNSIFKLDAKSIVELIKSHSKISDRLLERIIWAAAARANWYVVRSSLQLDNDADLKIAIFKRPIGILLSAPLTSSLNYIDQLGLYFHESLRMVSLGFGIHLSTSEIEEMTCNAFSNKDFELKKFPKLDSYISSLIGTGPVELTNERKKLWEITFESISQLKDLQFLPSGAFKTYFYQLESSKFESLREVGINLMPEQLERAFFGWAAIEAPTICDSLIDCSYSEAWPSVPYEASSISTWDLTYNDQEKMGWKDPNSNLEFVVTKQELSIKNALGFCEQLSSNLQRKFTLITSPQLALLKQYLSLELILNRNHLTTMENEGLPLLALSKNSFQLWAPTSDLAKGYYIINDNWDGYGRALCLRDN